MKEPFAITFLASILILGTFISVPPASAQTCITPSGLVSWWPLDETSGTISADVIDGNFGTHIGIPTPTAGKVSTALIFDGIDDSVKITASPNLDVGTSSGFTIEAWINPSDLSTSRPIVEWNNSGTSSPTWGTHFWVSVRSTAGGGPGSLFANIIDTVGTSNFFSSASGILTVDTFQHVALTYDKATGIATMYKDGVIVAQKNLGNFTPQTTYDLYLGSRPVPATLYQGIMDEVGIYSIALSQSQIQSIFNAGSIGKCIPDSDNDGVIDTIDNCPDVPNTDQFDSNNNRIGDVCDSETLLIVQLQEENTLLNNIILDLQGQTTSQLTCGIDTIQDGNECIGDPAIINDLSSCSSSLSTCQSDLATTQSDLTTVSSNLAICNDGLDLCQDDLFVIQNELVDSQTQVDDLLAQLASLPQNIIESLILGVQTLVDGDVLDTKDVKQSLKKLDEGLDKLQQGNEKACHEVEKFIKEVNKLVGKGDLDSSKAQPLLDEANSLLAECPVDSDDNDSDDNDDNDSDDNDDNDND